MNRIRNLQQKVSRVEIFQHLLKKLGGVLRSNIVTVILVLAAVVTCFFVPPDKEYGNYIQYKTVCCLLAMMLLVTAIKDTKFFRIISAGLLKKVHNTRTLVTLLVFIPAAVALLLTNDVAILAFVPFTIILMRMAKCEQHLPKTLILLALACNLSGVLSPIGTAQNLFLLERFSLTPWWFAQNMWPIAITGYGAILICCLLTKNQKLIPYDAGKRMLPRAKLAYYFVLFLLVVLAIFDITPTVRMYYVVTPLVIVSLLIMDRHAFKKTKYSILIMFVAAFIIAGNLSRIEQVNSLLLKAMGGHEFPIELGASQVIFNNTATLLLAQFVTNVREFIIGTALGKYGTILTTMSLFVVTKSYAKYDLKHTFSLKVCLGQLLMLALLLLPACLMIYL